MINTQHYINVWDVACGVLHVWDVAWGVCNIPLIEPKTYSVYLHIKLYIIKALPSIHLNTLIFQKWRKWLIWQLPMIEVLLLCINHHLCHLFLPLCHLYINLWLGLIQWIKLIVGSALSIYRMIVLPASLTCSNHHLNTLLRRHTFYLAHKVLTKTIYKVRKRTQMNCWWIILNFSINSCLNRSKSKPHWKTTASFKDIVGGIEQGGSKTCFWKCLFFRQTKNQCEVFQLEMGWEFECLRYHWYEFRNKGGYVFWCRLWSFNGIIYFTDF